MGIWEEATAELNSETNADFFYHDPKTFKVKAGFGEVPLPWGEYPEGMVKNTKESNEYDLNRGRIYPLPHEIFEKSNLANVAAQEQGTELNDPNFITASRLLHSYLNKGKSDINKRPSWLPVDAAQSAIDQSETGLDSEYYGGWGANFMNRFNMNVTAMGVNTAKLINAPPGVQRALYYMLETSDREGVLASNVAKGLFNVAADPLSWVGLGTLGIGTLGRESLKAMTKQGLKQFLEQSILTNAGKVAMSTVKAPFSTIGLEAGFYTAADNLARQNVKINGGGQENFSAGEALESYAIGATFGNTLSNAIPAVAKAGEAVVDTGKKLLGDMGENAQARLDAGENTTTMSSMGAGEIDKAIDTGIAKVGERFGDSQARYFETGRFEPPTAEKPVSIIMPTEAEPGIIAFHGSGANFNKFEIGMIGTGEGAQAFGYGLYFAQEEDIAKYYRDAHSRSVDIDGTPFIRGNKHFDWVVGDQDIADNLGATGGNLEQAIKEAKEAQQEMLDFGNKDAAALYANEVTKMEALRGRVTNNSTDGKVYKVGLAPKPEDLLDNELPFSRQTKQVQEKLIRAGYIEEDYTSMSGSMILEAIMTNIAKTETAETTGRIAEINIELKKLSDIISKNSSGYQQNLTDIGRKAVDNYDKLLNERKNLPYYTGFKKSDASRLASKKLAEAGIPGIKYLDNSARKTSGTSSNFVIFDDNMIKILEKYGIVGPVAITSLAATQNGEQDGAQ